jgi:hypothetical protein
MTTEVLANDLEDVKQQYATVKVANNGSLNYIRIESVSLPTGCMPESTPVLILLRPGQAKPEIYVKPGIKLSNGREPRSISPVTIEGESWLQFSYQLNWDPNQHSLVQFIEGALRRFAKNE